MASSSSSSSRFPKTSKSGKYASNRRVEQCVSQIVGAAATNHAVARLQASSYRFEAVAGIFEKRHDEVPTQEQAELLRRTFVIGARHPAVMNKCSPNRSTFGRWCALTTSSRASGCNSNNAPPRSFASSPNPRRSPTTTLRSKCGGIAARSVIVVSSNSSGLNTVTARSAAATNGSMTTDPGGRPHRFGATLQQAMLLVRRFRHGVSSGGTSFGPAVGGGVGAGLPTIISRIRSRVGIVGTQF